MKTQDRGGRCGSVTDGTGTELKALDCDGLYLGGGTVPGLPEPTRIGTRGTLTTSAVCNGTGLALSGVGDSVGCTKEGCLFGMPIPVPALVPTCLLVSFARPVEGDIDCTTSRTTLSTPLRIDVYNTCPSCPESAAHASDCSVGSAKHYATILLQDVGLTTGTPEEVPAIASKSTSDGQFCGVCMSSGGHFEGDKSWDPLGTGVARPCSDSKPCPRADFPLCRQPLVGAFGSPSARAVHETGGMSPANLGAGAPVDATLVGVFCVPPTLVPAPPIDAAAGLPGPAAIGLTAEFKLTDDSASHPPCH